MRMASWSPSTHRRIMRVGAVVAVLTGLGIASDHLRAQNPPPGALQDPRISFQQRAECFAFDDTRTSRQLRTGALRFIGTEPGRPIPNPVPVEAARSPEAAARAYLSVCGSLFGLQDQAGDLTVTRIVPADARRTVVRFQQRQSGIPIMGAELIVHLDDARNILVVAGKTLPQTGLNTIPVVGRRHGCRDSPRHRRQRVRCGPSRSASSKFLDGKPFKYDHVALLRYTQIPIPAPKSMTSSAFAFASRWPAAMCDALNEFSILHVPESEYTQRP
jgi:Fungalysin/Thermolysin Propeptide Motif